MRRVANYQDFIKFIALIAMLTDHIGLYFFPENLTIRLLGRIAMPIFCFFAGYNYKGKIRFDVLMYGALLHCISTIIYNEFIATNILISIFLGYIYLHFFYARVKNFDGGFIHVIVLSCLWRFTEGFIDYGTLSIAVMVLGCIAKHDNNNFKLSILIVQALSILHTLAVFEPDSLRVSLVLIMGISNYFLMTAQNLKTQINLNLTPLTRNLLFIFFIQSALIEIAWVFYNRF